MVVDQIDNILYGDAPVFGENAPAFWMPFPNDDIIDFQISCDNDVAPYLWIVKNNTVIYKLPPFMVGVNYAWAVDPATYPLLKESCFTFLIVNNVQYNANKGTGMNVILESEPILMSAHHDSLIKITVRNNETYDSMVFDNNYFAHTFINATLIQDALKEEAKTYIKSNGQEIKLSSRQFSNYALKTDYLPRYFHEHMALILSLDYVVFGTTLMVAKEGYSYTNIERYSLSQGGVNLQRALYNKLNSNCT